MLHQNDMTDTIGGVRGVRGVRGGIKLPTASSPLAMALALVLVLALLLALTLLLAYITVTAGPTMFAVKRRNSVVHPAMRKA
jgi:hypothetical protein